MSIKHKSAPQSVLATAPNPEIVVTQPNLEYEVNLLMLIISIFCSLKFQISYLKYIVPLSVRNKYIILISFDSAITNVITAGLGLLACPRAAVLNPDIWPQRFTIWRLLAQRQMSFPVLAAAMDAKPVLAAAIVAIACPSRSDCRLPYRVLQPQWLVHRLSEPNIHVYKFAHLELTSVQFYHVSCCQVTLSGMTLLVMYMQEDDHCYQFYHVLWHDGTCLNLVFCLCIHHPLHPVSQFISSLMPLI